MSRLTASVFALAGVLAIGRWVLDSQEVQYYDPQTFADYSAVLLQTGAGVATGIALILLWRKPPVRRGSALALIAGLTAIAQGMGNLAEDAFGLEWGEWGFFIGGIGTVFALAVAGVLALSVKSPMRWSGAFLVVGASGGMLGAGLLIMGISWIGFAAWIAYRLDDVRSAPLASA